MTVIWGKEVIEEDAEVNGYEVKLERNYLNDRFNSLFQDLRTVFTVLKAVSDLNAWETMQCQSQKQLIV